ncbi:MAG: hypothetical protein RL717_2820 [Pseudomonadota bacterium]|jgi:CopG family nickel-responsive transcriptional regulator
MERFTISLDDDLATSFDALIASRGYSNRSEAMRDILRRELETAPTSTSGKQHCIANLSYTFNHHERDLAERLTGLQHAHHDLTVSTMHAHLDHAHCIESVILQGPTARVREFANAMMAERGVHHGAVNIISVEREKYRHLHGHAEQLHTHLKPTR